MNRCKTSTFPQLGFYFLFAGILLQFCVRFQHCVIRRGMGRTYEAPSNEIPHMILGYHQGRPVTNLQNHFHFLINGNRLSPEPENAIFISRFIYLQLLRVCGDRLSEEPDRAIYSCLHKLFHEQTRHLFFDGISFGIYLFLFPIVMVFSEYISVFGCYIIGYCLFRLICM